MGNNRLLKFTLLVTSMMTMMAGAVVAPSLPQIAEVFHTIPHAGFLTRLVITLPALFIALFAPVFGMVSDRLGRKPLLIFSLILYAVGGSSGFYLENIYQILLGRAVLGIAVAGIMTISVALIGDYFKAEERNAFMGLRGAFVGLGGVVFVTVAGWLADIQWQMPFLIYLFSLPVLIMAVLYLYEPELKRLTKAQRKIKVAYDKRKAILIYFLAFITVVFFYMIPVQIPFLLGKFETISNSRIGYAISLQTFSSAIVSLNYSRIKIRFHFREIYQLGFVLMGIAYLIIGLSNHYGTVLLGLTIAGMATGIMFPSGNLWIMEIAPEKIRGTLVGRVSMSVFLGMFLSPILIQPLIHLVAVSGAFIVAFGLLVLLASALYLVRKEKKIPGI